MPQKTIWFESDGLRIHGTLHRPDIDNTAIVIGAHGLMSNGDSPKQIALAEKCNAIGISYFRFDHRGCGQSEGEFKKVTTFKGRCRDLLDGIKNLRDMGLASRRMGLFGSSLGGAAVLATAGQLNPQAIVTVASPVRSTAIRPPYINEAANLPILESMDKEKLFFDIADRITGISDLMLFHGNADPIVPFENALEIYELASDPKELVRLENGDHPMSDEAHQSEFMGKTIAWYREKLL